MSRSLRITPVFPVPVGETQLDACADLNRELEALFLARATADERNPTPSHVAQDELYESRFNLFRWPEACVQQLRRFMLDAILSMVRQTTSLSSTEMARLRVHNHTWFHITRFGGSFVAHNHPLASWSAVYCVRPGEAPAAYPRSGLLRFFDTRSGADLYADAATQQQLPTYAAQVREYRLCAGQLVIFPSYLFHEVTPFYGSDTRITVATNCWFDRV